MRPDPPVRYNRLSRNYERNCLLNHIFRAALFDGSVYRELDEQPEHMFRALGMVFIAALAFGAGIWSYFRQGARPDELMELNLVLFVGIATIIMGWVVWTGFAWMLGTKLFGGDAGYRVLLRAMGLSYLPICVWLFVNVPYGGAFLSLASHLWLLSAGITAIKYTEDFAWWKAIISGAIGWVWALVMMPLFLVLAPAFDAVSS